MGAVNASTKALVKRVISEGIRVNSVAAGLLSTPLNPADSGPATEEVAEFGYDTPLPWMKRNAWAAGLVVCDRRPRQHSQLQSLDADV